MGWAKGLACQQGGWRRPFRSVARATGCRGEGDGVWRRGRRPKLWPRVAAANACAGTSLNPIRPPFPRVSRAHTHTHTHIRVYMCYALQHLLVWLGVARTSLCA